MKSLRSVGIAGGLIAAAFIGGTLISAAAAAPAPSTGSSATLANETGNGAEYCTVWQETFATELGVSVDKLVPAAKTATLAAIDAAVKNGDLPSDVADRMKAKIDGASGDGCRLLGGFLHRAAGQGIRADARHDLIGAAADALNLAPADLVKDLRSGDSLKQIATDQKVDYATVTKAVLDAAKADLDALVTAGKITQARADTMLANLTKALDAGRWPHVGPGAMPGPGA